MKEIEAVFIPLLKQIADPSLQNWKKLQLQFANVFANVLNLIFKWKCKLQKSILEWKINFVVKIDFLPMCVEPVNFYSWPLQFGWFGKIMFLQWRTFDWRSITETLLGTKLKMGGLLLFRNVRFGVVNALWHQNEKTKTR